MVKSDDEAALIYDGECPFCARYAQFVRLRKNAGNLRLINAREESVELMEITRAGLDIDQGIVLKLNGRLYYGREAMQVLALLSSRYGMFNRLNRWIFSSPKRARLFYPPMRAIRNLAIKVLGRKPIGNLEHNENKGGSKRTRSARRR